MQNENLCKLWSVPCGAQWGEMENEDSACTPLPHLFVSLSLDGTRHHQIKALHSREQVDILIRS